MGYGSLEAPPKVERRSRASTEDNESLTSSGKENRTKTLDVGKGEYEGW